VECGTRGLVHSTRADEPRSKRALRRSSRGSRHARSASGRWRAVVGLHDDSRGEPVDRARGQTQSGPAPGRNRRGAEVLCRPRGSTAPGHRGALSVVPCASAGAQRHSVGCVTRRPAGPKRPTASVSPLTPGSPAARQLLERCVVGIHPHAAQCALRAQNPIAPRWRWSRLWRRPGVHGPALPAAPVHHRVTSRPCAHGRLHWPRQHGYDEDDR
jgi:hypothetical protein